MTVDNEWLWYGGRVCLDFVNTLRDRWKEPQETLREPADVLRWLTAAELIDARRSPAEGDALLGSARRLREGIDRAVMMAAESRMPSQADLSMINDAARAAPRPAPQAVIEDGRLVPGNDESRPDDPMTALGLVARDAVELLLSPEISRVRVCGADRCALRFVDRSPAHNRRWCSMTRCGNRTKVRAHQLRQRR
ncbi:ABATE domain-containing protein [Actinomadura sp. B10D3]|uniref:CGNR zinc finger domain-containing protein n=1 Tax=Actinomadura sp. B10D3 TaxID=3153557 RepID=UPI00325EFA37